MARKNNHISVDTTAPPVDISISSTSNKTSPSDISLRSSLSGPSHLEHMAFSPSLPTMNKQADSALTVKMEDLVETKVVVTKAVQVLYEEEKLLTILNKNPPVFTGGIKSSIWKNVFHIDWAEMHHLIKLCRFDLSKYKGIAVIADVLKNPKYKKRHLFQKLCAILQTSCDLSALLGQQENTIGKHFHRTIEQINFKLPCTHEVTSSRDSN